MAGVGSAEEAEQRESAPAATAEEAAMVMAWGVGMATSVRAQVRALLS